MAVGWFLIITSRIPMKLLNCLNSRALHVSKGVHALYYCLAHVQIFPCSMLHLQLTIGPTPQAVLGILELPFDLVSLQLPVWMSCV
jgi:hypothetical protein